MATKSEIELYKLFKRKKSWVGSSEAALSIGISKGGVSRLLKGFGDALECKKVDKCLYYKASEVFETSAKVKDIIETMEIFKNDCK